MNMKSNPIFLTEDIQCEKCLCWDMMKNNALTLFNAHPSYPKELLERGSNQLQYKVITFKTLKETVHTCTQKFWQENGQVIMK